MKFTQALLAAAAAAVVGSAAVALEGAYESNGMTTTFNADGTRTVEVPAASITINETYTLEGDTLTITGGADDAFCMGAPGVYTVADAGDSVTFTVVNDPCEQRATSMAATWTKKAE
jgi:hypothetical protein